MSIVIHKDYLRSAIFGCNDALVSTTGVIVGVSVGTGEYNSVKSAKQFSGTHDSAKPSFSGLIMFVSYFLAGLVPLLPIFFLSVDAARIASIVFALLGLFALGYIKGKIVHVKSLKSALEIMIIGALATAVGLLAGTLLST